MNPALDSRARFEATAKSKGISLAIDPGTGEYLYDRARFGWEAWQAAIASMAPDPLQQAKDQLLAKINAQPDDAWRVLFAQVALALKCLPSSFVDSNGHVLRQAQLMAAQYVAPVECDQCYGSGEVCDHAPDCDSDLCEMNGDEHSCAGQLVPCRCVAPPTPQDPPIAALAAKATT